MKWFKKRKEDSVIEEAKVTEAPLPKTLKELVSSVDTAYVSYYDPMAPNRYQEYQLYDAKGSETLFISYSSDSVLVVKGSTVYSPKCTEPLSKKVIAKYTGVSDKKFVKDLRQSLAGDAILSLIMMNMNPKTDQLIELSENHYELRRAYGSGRKKFGDIKIIPAKEGPSKYRIKVHYGRNSRLLREEKEYSSNYPYRYLRKGSQGTLFSTCPTL